MDSAELVSGGRVIQLCVSFLCFCLYGFAPILDILIGEFTHHGELCVFLLSRNITFQGGQHAVPCINTSFLLRLNNIPLHGDHFFLGGVSSSVSEHSCCFPAGSLGIMLQWTILSSFCGAHFSFLLSTHLEPELWLGDTVSLSLTLTMWNYFPKRLPHFTAPPAVWDGSVFA